MNPSRKAQRKELERKITMEALNQKYLDLNAPLEVENKRLLIALLNKGYTDNMEKYKGIVTNTIEKCFKSVMPSDVLNLWKTHPDICLPFPGFLYTCEDGNTMQIELDLPMYFRPDICCGMFKDNWPDKVHLLEERIKLYNYHKNLRTKTEVMYAKVLLRIPTYYRLLTERPVWYKVLIDKLKENGRFDFLADSVK